ncbi:MAG: hypothetical protein U9O64_05630 [Campylobacterota bacterium]|nr:hypothetical protein [Campylobacterota bacterium]
MLDIEKIKKRASELYGEAGRKMRQYTPESFSKEKKFVNAVVISLVLMTLADEVVETEEVVASLDMLKDIDEINDLDMVQQAIELYEMHIEELSAVVGNKIKWTIAVAKLLAEVAKVKPYPEYSVMIGNLLDYIANADGRLDPLEVEMKDKILEAVK